MSFSDLLEKKGISGYRLAKDIGTPQQTISDYLTNKKAMDSMKIGMAYKIAVYLNMSLDEFYSHR